MQRILIVSITIFMMIVPCLALQAQEAKKIAVLYFTDHSRFDQRSGCGCFSLGPLNFIFGSGQSREVWDLKAGFRDLLNEALSKAGYRIVEPDNAERVFQAEKGNLSAIASELGADIMIIGDIRKFEQHRNRVSSQGYTRATGGMASAGQGMDMVFLGGIGGFYYSSTVRTVVTIYDSSGEQLEHVEIGSKKDLKDFFVGMGPLSKSYQGGKVNEEDQAPIVDYKKLDAMKFGTEEFKNRTLFGIATMDVMNQIVAKVEEYAGTPSLASVQGKVIYVGNGQHLKENEVYIDLGASDGLTPGHLLTVYPESSSAGVTEKKVGMLKVSKVEADHLSIAEIIDGMGQIGKGNIVKRE